MSSLPASGLQIVHYPHLTLRHASKPLRRVDAELVGMIREMFELMYAHKGVGLAANQVDLPYRVFVANPEGDPSKKDQEYVFLNPVISHPKGSAEAEEGCLSIPGLYRPVNRPERVRITAYNLKGEEMALELDGLFGRIVQHETDHLDGRLFVDRLSPTAQADVRQTLEEFELVYASRRERGELPSDEEIRKRISDLEALRT
jgi:peptide deformylase